MPDPGQPQVPGDETMTERAIRRAEELLSRLPGGAPPPPPAPRVGPTGEPEGAVGPSDAAATTAPRGPLPHLPHPASAPAELIGALRSAPSNLGPAIVLLRFAALVMVGACVVVWGADGGGEFWPIWVLFGFACALGFDAAIAQGMLEPDWPSRSFALHLWLTVFTAGVLVAVWLLAGAGSFWPSWALFGLGLVLLAHALLTPSEVFGRKEQLAARVDELTRTRSGVLDVQAAELRRIERDLHDGAQARLVALSMQLGRAEQRLGANGDPDPATIALIKGAQEEARQAIAELRDLSRGIAPPLLVDRGLVAAVEAQAQRSPLEVSVDAGGVDRRLPTVVESAAYFVASEALTNAAKHAGPAATVRITMAIDGPWLRLTVADDGPGGADPEGSGLAGLRGRAEALDGRLAVLSAAGSGTTIVAELPCGS